jgi:hypothetical protein
MALYDTTATRTDETARKACGVAVENRWRVPPIKSKRSSRAATARMSSS